MEAIGFWDKRATISGIPRGQQRALYDQRRRDVLPVHGIDVLGLDVGEFAQNRAKRLKRDVVADTKAVEARLRAWLDRN